MPTLFDNIKKVYKINTRCKNCQQFSELSIPKGVTIESFLKSEVALCKNCGVASLEKYNYPDTKPQEKVPSAKMMFGSSSVSKKDFKK